MLKVFNRGVVPWLWVVLALTGILLNLSALLFSFADFGFANKAEKILEVF